MLNEEDLRRLQLTLADMLKVFDGFCREHDIKYVLACGTLLGAVRREVTFEGETYPVPADTVGYLRLEYGDDFMTPAPPTQRHTHIRSINF